MQTHKAPPFPPQGTSAPIYNIGCWPSLTQHQLCQQAHNTLLNMERLPNGTPHTPSNDITTQHSTGLPIRTKPKATLKPPHTLGKKPPDIDINNNPTLQPASWLASRPQPQACHGVRAMMDTANSQCMTNAEVCSQQHDNGADTRRPQHLKSMQASLPQQHTPPMATQQHASTIARLQSHTGRQHKHPLISPAKSTIVNHNHTSCTPRPLLHNLPTQKKHSRIMMPSQAEGSREG
jgi:hypothetical protein